MPQLVQRPAGPVRVERGGSLLDQVLGARIGQPATCDRSIPRPRLYKLFGDDRQSLRERLLWRMFYETAARAEELLSVDVEDMDLEFRRARVRSKGARSSPAGGGGRACGAPAAGLGWWPGAPGAAPKR